MTGKVEIINLALARLGTAPVQALDEGSASANAARMFYDPARKATLRDYNWNFALKVTNLSRLADASGDFDYTYAMPADCIRVIRLRRRDFSEGNEGVAFATRGKTIVTDEGDAVAEYVADIEDPVMFDDKFVEAMSYRLASDMAILVAGKPDMMASYLNAYKELVKEAAALSANEQREHLSENPYLDARTYGIN